MEDLEITRFKKRKKKPKQYTLYITGDWFFIKNESRKYKYSNRESLDHWLNWYKEHCTIHYYKIEDINGNIIEEYNS